MEGEEFLSAVQQHAVEGFEFGFSRPGEKKRRSSLVMQSEAGLVPLPSPKELDEEVAEAMVRAAMSRCETEEQRQEMWERYQADRRERIGNERREGEFSRSISGSGYFQESKKSGSGTLPLDDLLGGESASERLDPAAVRCTPMQERARGACVFDLVCFIAWISFGACADLRLLCRQDGFAKRLEKMNAMRDWLLSEDASVPGIYKEGLATSKCDPRKDCFARRHEAEAATLGPSTAKTASLQPHNFPTHLSSRRVTTLTDRKSLYTDLFLEGTQC